MLVVPLVLLPIGSLAGCGDGEPEGPQRVAIPSVAPTAPTAPTTPSASPTATATPTRTSSPIPTSPPATPTRQPTRDPEPVTADGLARRIEAELSRFDTMQVAYGDDTPPPDLVLGVQIATGDYDLDVADPAGGAPLLDVRRVSGRLFVRDPADRRAGWREVTSSQLAEAESGALPSLYALDVVRLLGLALGNAVDVGEPVASDVDGVAAQTYELTLDPAAAETPTFVVSAGDDFADALTTSRAELSLTDDGLPVRLEFDVEPGGVVRLDFSGWGTAVDATVPPLG